MLARRLLLAGMYPAATAAVAPLCVALAAALYGGSPGAARSDGGIDEAEGILNRHFGEARPPGPAAAASANMPAAAAPSDIDGAEAILKRHFGTGTTRPPVAAAAAAPAARLSVREEVDYAEAQALLATAGLSPAPNAGPPDPGPMRGVGGAEEDYAAAQAVLAGHFEKPSATARPAPPPAEARGWSDAPAAGPASLALTTALNAAYNDASAVLTRHFSVGDPPPPPSSPPPPPPTPSTGSENTGPGGLLLHEDVLDQVGRKFGPKSEVISRLVELARVSVIELGDGEACLKCVDAAMAATPPSARGELHKLLWVEGLGCFYTGEWERGARHFEAEMAVNGGDVEVPVWRWLCDANNPSLGVKAARDRLFVVEGASDPRGKPFGAIWSLYKGEGSIEAVLADAKAAGSADALMWGGLYCGLYLEALGQHSRAKEQFEAAAAADSHNNIAQLAKTHLVRVRKAAADTEWATLQDSLKA